ncbi:putative galactinol--sucrose galactosyltransferase 1 [Zea mays]|uniref:Putative galactinol--sucrose galactosyltransferase 1 n=1 Tax=Zea mays TaxID=4577 RepID=A0A317Y6M9_MAIZE|nr:putative galactinol--sucrose galactosyltransferase 1 [Zea mays]
MQPDWDMFHSVHPMAEYHAAARAVGGCAIYVSDKPGSHDFNLLKKLVLPDGSILRAKFPGRPTRDCLFSDPARDGKSVLKIWNLNEHSGVVGAFNCQGAGWFRVAKKNLIHDQQPGTVSGVIQAQDVEHLARVADHSWNGDVVVYSHVGGEVVYLPKNALLPVTLRSREYEVFTVVPLKHLPNGASFAAIGLLGMFNSGGAVRELRFGGEDADVELRVRGSGTVGAYSSTKPTCVAVDSKAVGFSYDGTCGLISFELGIPDQEMYLWTVTVGVLKIWNLNEHSGVVGAFNCQGAGWCRVAKKNLIHDHQPRTVSDVISAQDVEHLARVVDHGWNGDVVVYSHVGGEVVYLPKNTLLPVTLRSREYEVFTVVPLKHLPNGVSFAEISLLGMFNSSGAVRELRFSGEDADFELTVRGSGTVGAYSSTKPRCVAVDSKAVGFSYDGTCGLISFELGIPDQEMYLWTVTVGY